LTNGGFETGTFAGWTVTNQAGSFPGSNFFVSRVTTTPQSGSTTVGPATGTFYAVSDGLGPGTHVLIQTFTVPGPASSVVVSFDLFANNYGDTIVNPIGLDFTDGANQQARVDILGAGASPFDTGAGVLQNFFLGADAGANPHDYTADAFNITQLVGAGGTFQLRFAEVDNQNFFNLGVDNISVSFTAAAVPEPGSITLAVLGFGALGFFLRRRPVDRVFGSWSKPESCGRERPSDTPRRYRPAEWLPISGRHHGSHCRP
jgi:hypothetical protein